MVKRDGISALTIEAAAREAGVSKGGVLYHFPSKDALIQGMLSAWVNDFELDLERQLAIEKAGPGHWLRAYIRSSFYSNGEDLDATSGLLAAVSNNPDLLKNIRQQYIGWQAQAEDDGVDPTLATIIRLAIDGLLFADMLNLAPPQGEQRRQVEEMLLRLAHAPDKDTTLP